VNDPAGDRICRPPATLVTSGAAMMKMFAGRPVEPPECRLSGAAAAEPSVF
jgi:hypothetical protein